MLLGIFLLAPTDSITIYKNEMLAEAVIDMGIDETADPAEREPTFKERLTQRRRSSVIGAHLHIGTPRSDLGTPRSEMGTPRTPGAPPLTTISSGKELVERNSRWNSPGGAAVAHAAERRSHAAGLGEAPARRLVLGLGLQDVALLRRRGRHQRIASGI